ncbi:hypothetical protein GIB67_033434 [Kingdonia uniflora]|uniref:SUN domain-containing protein n=1 Tax=Kingdonia uniflora TaxID=39325 RepID=A0A7J7LTV2_9MAGN|nr:hypothetical protein GIB67_033434 [Kingdonia uniflora]
MKKPRHAHIITNNNMRKSIYELSLSLLFSLWCVFVLFYSRLGDSHGNGDLYIEGGRNNSTIGMLLKLNLSIISNKPPAHAHNSADSNYSVREGNRLEKVVRNFLGCAVLECEVRSQDGQSTNKPIQEERRYRASLPSYLDLDEFRNKSMQGKEQEVPYQLVNITHRLEPGGAEYNYASASKGAKVLEHNKEAKGASNILGKDKDKYLRNPCSVEQKFVVIELSEETLVDAVKIANFEHYSSNFKDFELSGSLMYPSEVWTPLGKFSAANIKQAQRFMLPEPKWVRYLRLNLLSHYGSEFYCTLSLLEVYGIDAIERMLEDLIVVSEEKVTDRPSKPNSSVKPSSGSKSGSSEKSGSHQVQNVSEVVDPVDKIDDGQKLNKETVKSAVLKSNVPDPVMEVRHQPNGRIPGDTVLKILMQKVRSLELNLTVLQEYIKELNRRHADTLPELDKELSKNTLLLEKANHEIKALIEKKEVMENEIGKLKSWKSDVASQIDMLIKENSMLRVDIEKILRDQASLENKEVAILAVSSSIAIVAVLKLVWEQIFMLFRSSRPEKTLLNGHLDHKINLKLLKPVTAASGTIAKANVRIVDHGKDILYLYLCILVEQSVYRIESLMHYNPNSKNAAGSEASPFKKQ